MSIPVVSGYVHFHSWRLLSQGFASIHYSFKTDLFKAPNFIPLLNPIICSKFWSFFTYQLHLTQFSTFLFEILFIPASWNIILLILLLIHCYPFAYSYLSHQTLNIGVPLVQFSDLCLSFSHILLVIIFSFIILIIIFLQ